MTKVCSIKEEPTPGEETNVELDPNATIYASAPKSPCSVHYQMSFLYLFFLFYPGVISTLATKMLAIQDLNGLNN